MTPSHALALADALLEAGHPELADHFEPRQLGAAASCVPHGPGDNGGMAKWTAEDWDRSESAVEMLKALRGRRRKVDRRALRLFSLAVCCRFRSVVTDPRCLAALEAAKRDALSPLDREARHAAKAPALQAVRLLRGCSIAALEDDAEYWRGAVMVEASMACVYILDAVPLAGALQVSSQIAEAAAWELVRVFHGDGWGEARDAEQRFQANLLRHIVGNPFRSFPAPPVLPTAVVQLAAALEAGEPVVFALRDALLEAGQTDLAEHFDSDEPHPRGCWALDVIGGRA